MLNKLSIKNFLTLFISSVWLVSGLFCKVLNLVPRHQMIVSGIIGNEYAFAATKIIGVLEVLMFVWVLSKIKQQWCAICQMAIVAIMNVIEFILVPDLLLFGKANILVAAIFISIIFINQFILPKQVLQNSQ